MKRQGIIFKLLIVSILLPLFSCASVPEKKIDSMYVMVYDYDSSEVMDVSIFIDGKEVGKTDIYGRLSYPCDLEKEVVIRAEKDGYGSVETKAAIKSGIVLYFKMGSSSYYAAKAESLLDENNAIDALKMINAALQIEQRNDWLFLRQVILRRIEK